MNTKDLDRYLQSGDEDRFSEDWELCYVEAEETIARMDVEELLVEANRLGVDLSEPNESGRDILVEALCLELFNEV